MANKKNIWIVSELFYPEETSTAYYLTEVAKKMLQYKTVNVICGTGSYEKCTNMKSSNDDLPSEINVYRVRVLGGDKNNLVLRVFRLLSTALGLAFSLLINAKRGERILLVTNPAFLLPLAAIIAKFKKLKLTILVHDVFPENLIPVNILKDSSLFYRILKSIFDWSYASANQVIVLGRDMQELVTQKVGHENKSIISIIENWADVDSINPLDKNKCSYVYDGIQIDDKIVFQFAGNMGRLQGLEQLIDLATNCTNPLIHFIFVGEGALKNKLEMLVRKYNVSNVSFLTSFDRTQQNIFLNACDVGIVSLNDSMLGLGVPSKTYNILAAGKPILFLGNAKSEIGQMINETETGWQFEFSQKEQVLNFFNNFQRDDLHDFTRRTRGVAETKYAKTTILDKYAYLLNQ